MFYLFVDVPAGGKFCKKTRFVFLLMSLPGANFVKNSVFVIFKGFARVKNDVIWMVLSLRSVLERLVLKKYAECTSQRLKRTSGARVMNLSLSEYFCVVFLNLARGRETIKLPEK